MKFLNKLTSTFTAIIIALTAGHALADDKASYLDSILGVSVGMSVEQARSILAPLGESAGRETRSGGRKEGYLLRDSRFAWVAFKAGHSGKLKWVSANLSAGKEIPFSELGDLTEADSANDYQVIWNVPRGESGYRLVAKGQNGKASIVYLLSLD